MGVEIAILPVVVLIKGETRVDVGSIRNESSFLSMPFSRLTLSSIFGVLA